MGRMRVTCPAGHQGADLDSPNRNRSRVGSSKKQSMLKAGHTMWWGDIYSTNELHGFR
jgi:hypothetical protein